MSNPKPKNIAIAGAGGIGAYLVPFLFDYGVNRSQFRDLWLSDAKITLFDDDIVEASNTLHQNFREEDLGKFKAEVVADKTLVTPELRFMEEKDFPNFDFVFSCVDSMSFRKSLYEYGWANPDKLTWIDGRCNSRNIGVFNSTVSKEKLSGMISDNKERGGCLRAVDKENKVSHATPLIVAGLMTQQFLNYLRGELASEPVLMLI